MGFYDGFFGPGSGSLWVFSLTFFLGFNLTKATAYTKVFNLKSNIIATACFALGHNIDYRLALCMAAGQLIGGRLGAYLAIKNGAKLIRPIFISVVTMTIFTLVYKSYDGSKNLTKLINIFGLIPTIIFSIAAITSVATIYFLSTKRPKSLSHV